MTLLSQGRLTGGTIALLKQLAADDALVVFATARVEGEPRWYYQHGLQHRIIPECTVSALAEHGYIFRCGSSVPIYRITSKGREYLRLAAVRHAF